MPLSGCCVHPEHALSKNDVLMHDLPDTSSDECQQAPKKSRQLSNDYDLQPSIFPGDVGEFNHSL